MSSSSNGAWREASVFAWVDGVVHTVTAHARPLGLYETEGAWPARPESGFDPHKFLASAIVHQARFTQPTPDPRWEVKFEIAPALKAHQRTGWGLAVVLADWVARGVVALPVDEAGHAAPLLTVCGEADWLAGHLHAWEDDGAAVVQGPSPGLFAACVAPPGFEPPAAWGLPVVDVAWLHSLQGPGLLERLSMARQRWVQGLTEPDALLAARDGLRRWMQDTSARGGAHPGSALRRAEAWFPLVTSGSTVEWGRVQVAVRPVPTVTDASKPSQAAGEDWMVSGVARRSVVGAQAPVLLRNARSALDGPSRRAWRTHVAFDTNFSDNSYQLALVLADRMARGRDWAPRQGGRLLATGAVEPSGGKLAVNGVGGMALKCAFLARHCRAGDRVVLPSWAAFEAMWERSKLERKELEENRQELEHALATLKDEVQRVGASLVLADSLLPMPAAR